MAGRLHPDEVPVGADLARRLVDGAFPAWRGLPLRPLATAGTDNAMMRLGADMVLRLPRTAGAAQALGREARWMGRLAGLPLLHPPLALGAPAMGYPFPFAVLPWVEGRDAGSAPPADEGALALALGGFVAALRAVGVEGPGRDDPDASPRGGPLRAEDAFTRASLALAGPGEVDAGAALAAWEACLAAAPHRGPPLWFHGDLQPFNLVLRDGALVAVIDWGLLGTGDPACDLAPAWQALSDPAARATFREQVGADDAEWARGRGWALCKALQAIPYYRDSNPAFAAFARRTLGRVLADPG